LSGLLPFLLSFNRKNNKLKNRLRAIARVYDLVFIIQIFLSKNDKKRTIICFIKLSEYNKNRFRFFLGKEMADATQTPATTANTVSQNQES